MDTASLRRAGEALSDNHELATRAIAAEALTHGDWASRTEEPAGGKDRPVHDAITYLRNHGEAGRLDYAKARREGRPVGSGPVEATCKTVVEVRMKRCGTRWKHKKAARFIRLRAAARSGRWQLVIDTLLRIHTQQFVGLAAA